MIYLSVNTSAFNEVYHTQGKNRTKNYDNRLNIFLYRNYVQDDTYYDTQNDTYDNTYDGTHPAERADTYRTFLSRVFSDAGTRYAFEM